MSDPVQAKINQDLLVTKAKSTIAEAKELLDTDSPNQMKIRRVRARMSSHMEMLNQHKPDKNKEDVNQFYVLVTPILYELHEICAELDAISEVPIGNSRRSGSGSSHEVRNILTPVFMNSYL